MTEAEEEVLRRAVNGQDRCGSVFLRNFDQGLVETLGAYVEKDAYWLDVAGVDPPPGMPGTPVTFSFSEDVFKSYKVPMVLIRRTDVTPAMDRWHPGTIVYRTPATSDLAEIFNGKKGPLKVEEQKQANPFDLSYEISVLSHYRDNMRGSVQRIFEHVLRVYQAYSWVYLKDSLNQPRSYFAFMEGTQVLDEIGEVAERVLGFSVSVRVEAELDLNDPYVVDTVWSGLRLGAQPK